MIQLIKKEAGKFFRILSSQFDLGIKVKYQDKNFDDLGWLK